MKLDQRVKLRLRHRCCHVNRRSRKIKQFVRTQKDWEHGRGYLFTLASLLLGDYDRGCIVWRDTTDARRRAHRRQQTDLGNLLHMAVHDTEAPSVRSPANNV